MASATANLINLTLLFSLLLHCGAAQTCSNYVAIYQFGDSSADTGNFILESPADASSRLPYGETYFKTPTGRCSDGRIVIDYIANELDLPFVDPYLNKEYSPFPYGANFAVAGATSLQTQVLLAYNITVLATNSSLLVQLDWFFNHLTSICNTSTECTEKLKKALFMVGKVGNNDYTRAFLVGKTIDQARVLVPLVVNNIIYAAKKLINAGATRLIVPGSFPIGCSPMYLTVFKSNDSASYDEAKCLKDYNKFSRYHNSYLRHALSQLRKQLRNVKPNVVLLYADYYNGFQWIRKSGFQESYAIKACCGTGGDYNFDLAKMCGFEGASVCSNPQEYVSWDGIHLTDRANQLLTKWLLRRHPLKKICVSSY